VRFFLSGIPMPYLIDAHEDLSWNWLSFGTDYTRPLAETRTLESGIIDQHRGGSSLLGWPEYSNGQVAVVFGTYFITPKKYADGDWDRVVFSNPNEYGNLIKQSADYYHMLANQYPDNFSRIFNRRDLTEVLQPWQKTTEIFNPDTRPPIGIINLIEGSEGLGSLSELEEWWELGVRILGPVWAGTRFCGGSLEGKGFTGEGRQLLSAMAEIGFILDVAHMNDESMATALNEYEGTVIATHANCRWLLRNPPNQRHLSRDNVRRIIDRNGVIGVLPYARFLRTDWDISHPVSLNDYANHIDAICQTAGNTNNVGIGTDFDCGFGWPSVPKEINSIADMQKLAPILQNRGYTTDQVETIFHGNWERILLQALPES
jgi:membrane dipeptidase